MLAYTRLEEEFIKKCLTTSESKRMKILWRKPHLHGVDSNFSVYIWLQGHSLPKGKKTSPTTWNKIFLDLWRGCFWFWANLIIFFIELWIFIVSAATWIKKFNANWMLARNLKLLFFQVKLLAFIKMAKLKKDFWEEN